MITPIEAILPGDPDGERQADRCQPSIPRGPGLSEPTPRGSDRSAVSRGRFFRSPRPGPGQVRDAAPGAARGAAGQPGIGDVRFFASGVLSGAVYLRTGRTAGTDAEEARAARRAQADRGRDRVCSHGTEEGRLSE